MLSNPKPNDRVEIRYAKHKRSIAKLHGKRGVVVIAGRGRPRNHGVEVDGVLYVIPAGQLFKEREAMKKKELETQVSELRGIVAALQNRVSELDEITTAMRELIRSNRAYLVAHVHSDVDRVDFEGVKVPDYDQVTAGIPISVDIDNNDAS